MGALIRMIVCAVRRGCPCTRLVSWTRMAICDSCHAVFPLKKVDLLADGSLVHVPCVRLEKNKDPLGRRPAH